MHATNNTVKDLLSPVISLPAWNARETLGIKFELGEISETGRGTYGFWIFCSHWWLKRGMGTNFIDIVNSESSKDNIEKKIKVLNGKKLIGVEYHDDGLTTFFDFEDDLFLHISPYGKEETNREQWMFFTPERIISLLSNGSLSVEPRMKTE